MTPLSPYCIAILQHVKIRTIMSVGFCLRDSFCQGTSDRGAYVWIIWIGDFMLNRIIFGFPAWFSQWAIAELTAIRRPPAPRLRPWRLRSTHPFIAVSLWCDIPIILSVTRDLKLDTETDNQYNEQLITKPANCVRFSWNLAVLPKIRCDIFILSPEVYCRTLLIIQRVSIPVIQFFSTNFGRPNPRG